MTKPGIISTTEQTPEGEWLWHVHYASSYYDNDPRGPGESLVDGNWLTLAKTPDEAKEKVKDEIAKLRKQKDKGKEEKITATIVDLKDLIPTRNTSGDGRLGWSSGGYSKIDLCKKDKKRYRLCVCLVPVE